MKRFSRVAMAFASSFEMREEEEMRFNYIVDCGKRVVISC
jgi:hypothetical protein